jgi:hypothetical protein
MRGKVIENVPRVTMAREQQHRLSAATPIENL